jgi:Anti-sigma-K factor rskA/Putative zinc-finger
MDSHENYLELCAASTAGELSAKEEQKLQKHLAVCASCRRVKHEYESAIQEGIPALADDLASNVPEPEGDWSVETAEVAFFKRLEANQNNGSSGQGTIELPETEPTGRRFTYRPSRIPWAALWMPVAACALLAIALGIVAYRSGLKRGADSPQKQTVPPNLSVGALEEQISDSGHERAQLLSRLADDDRALEDLKREVTAQSDEIKRLKELRDALVASRQNATQSSADGSGGSSRRTAELAAAQANLQQLQAKADALGQQRDAAASHAAVLEAKVNDLTQLAREREQTVNEQQAEIAKEHDLLDHDRDIRELMGARDLYIAEVHDVAGNAETDKTYGRVFYTKGKSLIFYAYDLDQEAGLKAGNTFQAWGRRGIDKQQALSLGVFYEDNSSKKRWVLKFDDPKTLATIDAVFVTVEPSGGSHHPSGKQLLFAYLRVAPNHP